MAVSLAVWSQALQPGDGIELLPPADLRIVNAALGPDIVDEDSRCTLRLIYSGPNTADSDEEDQEDSDDKLEPVATVLCSLTPGKIEQAALNVVLEGGQAFAFENTGKNVIYLTGNFIDQMAHDDPPSEDELGLPEDEEALHLEDVSSDVEVEAEEIELADDEDERGESEPAKEKPVPASKKRALEAEEEEPKTLSKAERKQLKKLKGQSGQAVPVVAEDPPKKIDEVQSEGKSEGKKKKEKKEKEKEKTNEVGVGKDSSKGVQEVAGGVRVQDRKVGSGTEATKGSTVRMRYTGKLDDGSVFDNNQKGKPFEFTIGDGDVIKGWDVGISGMKEGGERILVIPPSMGYGKRKQSGIPPNSTLTFEVKLLKVVS